VRELIVEGGSTASRIVRRMSWTRFFPCQELTAGVVRMKVGRSPNIHLTVKPGSYPWPENAFCGE
jgi:hypothetical protein